MWLLVTRFVCLFRYQVDASEGSIDDDKSESFSVIRLLHPPSHPTARTSKNVSMFTVFISEWLSLYTSFCFFLSCILSVFGLIFSTLTKFTLFYGSDINPFTFFHSIFSYHSKCHHDQGCGIPAEPGVVEYFICLCDTFASGSHCHHYLETASKYNQSCFHGKVSVQSWKWSSPILIAAKFVWRHFVWYLCRFLSFQCFLFWVLLSMSI